MNADKTTGKNRKDIIKTLALALVVVALHVVAIGGFFTIQGCGTVREPVAVEPAPAPVMPPRVTPKKVERKAPRRTIRPPAAVKPASSVRPSATVPETYTIQKGDSLGLIAHRYGISTKELAEINGIKNPNLIRVGQKLTLPPYVKKKSGSSAKPAAPERKKAPAPAPIKVAPGSQYVVQPGDVLSRIAVRHGTTVKALREANKLTSDRILVGQKLTIPGGSAVPAVPAQPAATKPATEPAVAEQQVTVTEEPLVIEEDVELIEEDPVASVPNEEAFYYKAQAGDTLQSVAMTFGLIKEELMKANNIPEEIELKEGQRILIPMP
jgi:LysM repeat protein